MISRTVFRCSFVKAIARLPASTATQSSIRKQVKRCSRVAWPLSSKVLGSSWILTSVCSDEMTFEVALSISQKQSACEYYIHQVGHDTFQLIVSALHLLNPEVPVDRRFPSRAHLVRSVIHVQPGCDGTPIHSPSD